MRKNFHPAKSCYAFSVRLCKFLFAKPENFYHLTIGISTIVAGIWIYHLFISERNAQPHLGMDVKITISTNSPALGERRLVFLDLVLNNEGKRKLEAKEVPTDQIAYQDPGETLQYPCGIQVREIQTSLIQTNKSLDWFNDTNQLKCPFGIPDEIDMLGEYELIDTNKSSQPGTPEFWIEPTEQYHLGTTLILPKGDYLIRTHFIGNNADEDFWSQITYMQVY